MMDLPEAGDHLVSPRRGYAHHGLYVGGGRVIHYAGNARPGVCGPVEEVPLGLFVGGSSYWIKQHADRKHGRCESVARAKSRLGEDGYCVFANNCEHFIEWCINGDHASEQVNTACGVAAGGMAAAGTGAGIATVSATGAVAGLSGSGIMSGLATVGGAMGGGALAGLATLAAAPGIATAAAMNATLLKDNEALAPEERDARLAGRFGTFVGAGAATVGGAAAVGAMGATAGFSAAGISSGLAAIGACTGAGSVLTAIGVGGSAMAGGVAVTVAAPAVAAAALGYGVYRAARWFRDGSTPPGDCGPAAPLPIPAPAP